MTTYDILAASLIEKNGYVPGSAHAHRVAATFQEMAHTFTLSALKGGPKTFVNAEREFAATYYAVARALV